MSSLAEGEHEAEDVQTEGPSSLERAPADGAAGHTEEKDPNMNEAGATTSEKALKSARDNDIIRWPEEEPAKKEIWEVEPVHEWEKEERSYIFEAKLEKATEMKEIGNKHFRACEWDLALRRYRRALYHGHLDEMQMFDLTEQHKADVDAVLTPCKLNFAFCVTRMIELGEVADPPTRDTSTRQAR